MGMYVALSVLCALTVPTIFGLLIAKVLPGYYPSRVAWVVGVGVQLAAILCLFGIIFCMRRTDSVIIDSMALPFSVAAMLAVCVSGEKRLRLHFFCIKRFEEPGGLEYISLSQLIGLMREYARQYPGVMLVVRRDDDPDVVALEVQGKVIATLQVPEFNANGVVYGLYYQLVEVVPNIDYTDLRSVGLVYASAEEKYRMAINPSMPVSD